MAVLLLAGGGLFFYLSHYYPADAMALTNLHTHTKEQEGNLTILPGGKTGLIFYPGAKVEHTAYLPLLERLQKEGLTCVLVEMPFRLAVLHADAADAAIAAVPEVTSWYIGGHSLGGAIASSYAAEHPGKIQGAILLGAYIYGDLAPSHALTLYGSEDTVLNKRNITYTENVVELLGGNHAQFGNYGVHAGDGTPHITAAEQQAQAVAEIMKFIP